MIIPEGYGQFVFSFAGQGLPSGGAVVVGFRNDTPQSAIQCADDAKAAWVTRFMPSISSAVQFTTVLCKLGPAETGESALSTSGAYGSLAVTQTSPATCYLIRKYTGFGGRRGRGRMYIPGPVENDVNVAGDLQSSRVTALTTACAGFLTDMQTAGCSLVVLHNDGTPPYGVTELRVDPIIATQRRRLRR